METLRASDQVNNPSQNKGHCGIIGDPIDHSLSPLLHRSGYEALHVDYEFEAIRIVPSELEKFMQRVRTKPWRGISVTIPHKVQVMRYLDQIDPAAQQIGAVNTVLNNDGVLAGYNTDWFGALQQVTPLLPEGKPISALVLGAGGSARGVVYALQKCCHKVTVTNRSEDKSRRLAEDFGVEVTAWSKRHDSLADYQLIFNTTSLGMGVLCKESPLEQRFLTPTHIVCDAVYTPYKTRLISEAEAVGCAVGLGYQMLLWQGIRQFELFTGQKAPIEVMTEALLGELVEAL